MYPITSAIDYYSGYYQIPLDMMSRDMTAFMTDLGLVRTSRLPQGWTNSVSVFMRIICKVHWRQIPHQVRPFLDDCGIKGPKDRYGDEEEVASSPPNLYYFALKSTIRHYSKAKKNSMTF